VRRIAAIGPGNDITAKSGGTARPAVARSAAIARAGSDTEIFGDVTGSIAYIGTLAVLSLELALKQLTAPANRSEGIAGDQVGGRIRSLGISPAGSNLFGQRLRDAFISRIRSFRFVDELARSARRYKNAVCNPK
jgi:hypothetical protein